ncbi:MAG: hypothetical protein K0S19_674 [Geminicoccaceae bacterium]|nr:hypothetical protein [Geminicoccaceae bacterium]
MTPALVVARRLTILLLPLAVLASASGAFVRGLYRDPAAVVPAMRGQDLVTLAASGLLLGAVRAAGHGSARGLLAWIGLLGYMGYAFTGAAFAYGFNELFLVYIALFAISIAALVASLVGTDLVELRQRFDPATPRRAVAFFLVFIALVLGVSELGQIVQSLSEGTVPDLIIRSRGAGNFVYVLDLGVVLPLALLGARWLVKDEPWGYVLAGSMLIKAITMGFALLAATWLSVGVGIDLELGLTLGYAAIAFGGLGLSLWFFTHCRD